MKNKLLLLLFAILFFSCENVEIEQTVRPKSIFRDEYSVSTCVWTYKCIYKINTLEYWETDWVSSSKIDSAKKAQYAKADVIYKKIKSLE